MVSQCQALHLSDERRCTDEATHANGSFCHFHARQAYGLYKGYKRRNAQLDYLIAHPPPALQNQALSNHDFHEIEDENTLRLVHDHIFQRHALLDRVIRARRLHHSRFYALELDYGHQQYLDQLSSQKYIALRALERLERRVAEVLFRKEKWFHWIMELEDREEKERDAEKKKVKQEAALFKRHRKEVESHTLTLRRREDEQRQQEFLEKAWQERQTEILDEASAAEEWDPIEDVVQDDRGSYIDLLRHFLWQTQATDSDPSKQQETDTRGTTASSPRISEEPEGSGNGGGKSNKAKKKSRKAKQIQGQTPSAPNEFHVETADEMRHRLGTGQKLGNGALLVRKAPPSEPREAIDHIPALGEEEITTLLKQIADIKQLLFCRLVLAHPALLSAALRAPSIDAFLADESLSSTDLRDLCLKMEQPGLQELRDACADLDREELNEEDEAETGEAPKKSRRRLRGLSPRRTIPKSFQTKREKNLKAQRESVMPSHTDAVDFGDIDDQGQYHIEKIRVKVCGKYIYNYPSEKAMSRGGWLQFSILAKDCSLFDTVKLCRSWDEFFELSILTCYNYFPAIKWAKFIGDQSRQQLIYLGFFPYFQMDGANKISMHHQTGSRHQGRRQHAVVESRNFICAHLKRNDATSRRFIQYVAMRTHELVMFVRDVKTGNVLVQPPREQLWLLRRKAGIGRAVKNDEWEICKKVGPEFQEEMDSYREWHLDFKEYYDIVIWDLEPGRHFAQLYNAVQSTLIKANRFQTGLELYNPAKHILQTIYSDEEDLRTRDIPPGQEDKFVSVWGRLHSSATQMKYWDIDFEGETARDRDDEAPSEWKYTEADRLEDAVLFPWDRPSLPDNPKGKTAEAEPALTHGKVHTDKLMPNFERFVHDLDTDEELSDLDSNERTESDESFTEDEEGTENDMDDPSSESAPQRELSEVEREFIASHDDWHDISDQPPEGSFFRSQQRLQGVFGIRPEVEEDWEVFLDRERASYFKKIWHESDMEPDARERWTEYQRLVTAYRQWRETSTECKEKKVLTKSMTNGFRTMVHLGHGADTHYRVVRDMRNSDLLVSLLFDDNPSFLASEDCTSFRDSLLLNQQARSARLPDIRSHHSNKTRPAEHWQEWDNIHTINEPNGHFHTHAEFPPHWSLTLQPKIARLYKEGVICPSYNTASAGPTVCLTEPDREGKPDLYFDWRHAIKEVRLPRELQDPTRIDPLLEQAQHVVSKKKFSRQDARFTVLKLWSAPHFWPLMLGADNRDNTSFVDLTGRIWEWMFIPKDMPCSEWSIHHTLRMRMDPYEDIYFGDKIRFRRDMVLVVGKDEKECRELTTSAVFAIQTRPWRLEVDPWKSWWNVDLEFLERLDGGWWV